MDFRVMWCSAALYACLLLAVVETRQVTQTEWGVMAHSQPLVVNGFSPERGTFPWHVSVYKKRGSSYEYRCGGSLISSDLVVSAAHCFYDEINGQVYDVTNFMIAAGKYYRAYNHIKDTHVVQKSAVSKISVPPNYIGRSGNYAKDIAVVRLKTPFKITALVKPVLVDWSNTYESVQLREKQMGKVMGWGTTEEMNPSEELREINLPFVPYQKCSEVVPPDFKPMISPDDKFCAGHLNGSSVCHGDSGGGLCFELNGRWYLQGIVSSIPTGTTDLPCNNHMYATFTHVGRNRHWIRAAYDGLAELNFCILPDYPAHGSYQVLCPSSGCNSDPGERVPLQTGIYYRCNLEYAIKGLSVTNCIDNEWSKPSPTCVKIPSCPPLRSKNIVCRYKGEVTSCANVPIRHGTQATCGTFYKSSDYHSKITCLANNLWDHPEPRCVPECGKAVDKKPPLIIDGSRVAHDDFPWVAYVTKQMPILNVRSVEMGVGTLISADLVVVGALVDAYWVMVKSMKEHVSVTVGEYHTLRDNARHGGQESSVEDIILLPSDNRIALIRVTTPFVMTALVRPVCLDWDNRLATEQLWEGNIGRMPYIPLDDVNPHHTTNVAYFANGCPRNIRQGNYDMRTEDFCAQVTDSRVTLKWFNYGSGVSFQSDGLWYLRGVMTDNDVTFGDWTVGTFLYFNIGKQLDWFYDAYKASAV